MAFQRLLERHYDFIYRLAWRFTGHKQDAEDIAQDVCIKLADKIKLYRGDAAFTSWLYPIILNSCRDFIKRQGNRRRVEHAFEELQSLQSGDAKDDAQKTAWLYRVLAELGSDLQETALLILAEEKSHAEAASILGCAESTISWRMHELRKHLKQRSGDTHDE